MLGKSCLIGKPYEISRYNPSVCLIQLKHNLFTIVIIVIIFRQYHLGTKR